MKITWFGHSCFRLDIGRSALLIDPFLKGNPTFEASKIGFADAIKGVTHVALTHGHSDHVGSAGEICKTNGATLLATYELALFVKGQGAEKIEPMNTGGMIKTTDFDLTLVNALHSSSWTETGTYLGNPNGIIVAPKSGSVVYAMGDTDMFADMELIQAFHKPAIGLVPIGDRFTMGSKAAAFACRRFFTFSTVIPCHYGTFPGMLEPNADAFASAMSGSGTKVAVPKVGEALTLA
jgi:L-ascorbate metabolism protein UlaG (beta-lactamase superfamily)